MTPLLQIAYGLGGIIFLNGILSSLSVNAKDKLHSLCLDIIMYGSMLTVWGLLVYFVITTVMYIGQFTV